MWENMPWLRNRRSMEIGVIFYCWVVVIARHRAGSESCVDKLGDTCKTVGCSLPGIRPLCAKTCKACTEAGCGSGYYETVERRCESCNKLPVIHTGSYNSSCVCPDGKWGRDCNETCSVGCISTCRRWTGACNSECKHCYFRDDCSSIYDNCICDSPGVCKCKEGYLGKTCAVRCPETCLNFECNESRECTRGCKNGWYGIQCGSKCQGNCESGTCRRDTGYCDKGCTPGWYGNRCDMRCPGNCESGTCRRDTGYCDKGCTPGWYGNRCDLRCPGNCASEKCGRIDGACSPCRNGFSGFNCSTSCPRSCATKSCIQGNGSCYKCTTGYSGSHCNTSCPDNCVTGSCEQHGASCTGCKPGYRGLRCNTRCPDKCSRCHQKGIRCTSCTVNWYGKTCDKSCDTCLNGTCNITDGSCLLGCKDGWWGSQCNSTCPTHCARCDRVDAGCVDCEENYYGDNCSSRCSPKCGRCDRAGHCLTCAEGWEGDSCHESTKVSPSTLILTCVVVVLLLIIVIMAIKSLSKRGSRVYLSPHFEEDAISPTDDLPLQELDEARDSIGSQYERIPDTAVLVEGRGYEQLRQPPQCTGYTSLRRAEEA